MATLGSPPVKEAMLGSTNLIVGGLGLLSSLAVRSWTLLSLTLVAYAALVAWDLISAKQPEAERPELPDSRLPDASDLRSEKARKIAAQMLRARTRLEDVLAKSPAQISRYLGGSLTSLPELEDRAARLLQREDELSAALEGMDARAVQSEVSRLAAQVLQSKDSEARAELQGAQQARREQLDSIEALLSARSLVDAQLERLVATWEALPARAIRLGALDAQAADALSADVGKELDRMNNEIAAFEDTLKGMGTKVRA